MLLRVTVANITPEDTAAELQRAGFDATVFGSIGAGTWGIEHGTTIETIAAPDGSTRDAGSTDLARAIEDEAESTEPDSFLAWVVRLLVHRKEQAAYLTADGRHAFLLGADRRVTVLA